MPPEYQLDPEIAHYYGARREADRLVGPAVGRLEFERTVDVLARHLPGSGRVLDVGGGPGRYAVWLAEQGYDVELFDAVELHVHQAAELAAERGVSLRADVGDARAIERPDRYADAVVLLGPLYHLTGRADRLRCLQEARRVLRPDGVLVAAGISRFAAVLDNLGRRMDDDQWYQRWTAIRHTMAAGTHVNPERQAGLFTTAFFHHPDELASEVAEAGFAGVSVVAVEGPGLLLGDLEARAAAPRRWSHLLEVLRLLESEPSMLGSTGHLLATATR